MKFLERVRNTTETEFDIAFIWNKYQNDTTTLTMGKDFSNIAGHVIDGGPGDIIGPGCDGTQTGQLCRRLVRLRPGKHLDFLK